MKKITRATIKSFIKKNWNGLYIKELSRFDGMVDCVMEKNGGFTKVIKPSEGYGNYNYDLGIAGAWFVGQSRDSFEDYSDDYMVGYKIYNCCGSFILAFQK